MSIVESSLSITFFELLALSLAMFPRLLDRKARLLVVLPGFPFFFVAFGVSSSGERCSEFVVSFSLLVVSGGRNQHQPAFSCRGMDLFFHGRADASTLGSVLSWS